MSDIRSERMVGFVEKLLTVLMWLNWVCAGVIGALLAALIIIPEQFVGNAGRDGITSETVTMVRIAMLIGLIMVPLAHVALAKLKAIVASVRAGDPFVGANAQRLTAIAWALLGIMTCDLAFGYVSLVTDEQMGWSPSLTGWLAVLLLFVLARVFDHGTRLRDEMEGTV